MLLASPIFGFDPQGWLPTYGLANPNQVGHGSHRSRKAQPCWFSLAKSANPFTSPTTSSLQWWKSVATKFDWDLLLHRKFPLFETMPKSRRRQQYQPNHRLVQTSFGSACNEKCGRNRFLFLVLGVLGDALLELLPNVSDCNFCIIPKSLDSLSSLVFRFAAHDRQTDDNGLFREHVCCDAVVPAVPAPANGCGRKLESHFNALRTLAGMSSFSTSGKLGLATTPFSMSE